MFLKNLFLLYFISGREYENLIMDCCQLDDGVSGVKREDAAGNDPENGSPDADRGGKCNNIFLFFFLNQRKNVFFFYLSFKYV